MTILSHRSAIHSEFSINHMKCKLSLKDDNLLSTIPTQLTSRSQITCQLSNRVIVCPVIDWWDSAQTSIHLHEVQLLFCCEISNLWSEIVKWEIFILAHLCGLVQCYTMLYHTYLSFRAFWWIFICSLKISAKVREQEMLE